jgi:hypothetical protein
MPEMILHPLCSSKVKFMFRFKILYERGIGVKPMVDRDGGATLAMGA